MHKNSYTNRIVNYEVLHKITVEDFICLVDSVNPKDNDKILDAGCGYGAVTRELLKSNNNFFAYLLDNNKIQIKRAIDFFNKNYELAFIKERLRFFNTSIQKTSFKNNYFDKIICKMLIHEIEKQDQQTAINEIYRILKRNGKLIIWDVLLDEYNSDFFRAIINAKDKFAGYKSLEEKRYFFTMMEINQYLSSAEFKDIKTVLDISYCFSTYSRYESEFLSNNMLYEKWMDYIKSFSKSYSNEFLEKISYKDSGDDISFILPIGILSATK